MQKLVRNQLPAAPKLDGGSYLKDHWNLHWWNQSHFGCGFLETYYWQILSLVRHILRLAFVDKSSQKAFRLSIG